MTRGRLRISVAMLVLGAGLLAASTTVAPGAGDTRQAIRKGGTFRIGFQAGTVEDNFDPAVYRDDASGQLLRAVCALLLRNPDRPPPAGFRVVPEVATRLPRISRNGKTFTFTIRKGYRFSNGAPVTAGNYARAITRLLDPRTESGSSFLLTDLAGATARGSRLVIRTTRPAWTLLPRLTLPDFCPVPVGMPVDPEGAVRAPFSGGGPYYLASWRRGVSAVLRRNPHYRGPRPRHVDAFVARFDVDPDQVRSQVERGALDWGDVTQHDRSLARRYGINRSRFWVTRGLTVWSLAMNTSRPLFRNNVRLRRAVNFALDRPRIMRVFHSVAGFPYHGVTTDQYLAPGVPGFRDARIYPLRGPDLRRARSLAKGRTRGKRALLYTFSFPAWEQAARVAAENLAKIGLQVEVRTLAPGPLLDLVRRRGARYDLFLEAWFPDYPDPYVALQLLDGRTIRKEGNTNPAYFSARRYRQLFARAERLEGAPRYRAFGALDVRLARDAAPLAALFVNTRTDFFSKRAGCLVFNRIFVPNFAAACLER